jgi:hypothetical protein
MDKVTSIGVSFQLLSKVGWVELINENLGRRYRLGWVRFSCPLPLLPRNCFLGGVRGMFEEGSICKNMHVNVAFFT